MPDMNSFRDALGPVVYMAPEETPPTDKHKLFLAGSIDMGAAIDWQKSVIEGLAGFPDVHIYNPRRDDWDSSWVQDISDPQFSEQVRWELAHLAKADVICYYFDPKGKAPITLLELGLHAASGKAVVCCPEGYWRRGNVQIVCDDYGIPLLDTLEELITELKVRFGT